MKYQKCKKSTASNVPYPRTGLGNRKRLQMGPAWTRITPSPSWHEAAVVLPTVYSQNPTYVEHLRWNKKAPNSGSRGSDAARIWPWWLFRIVRKLRIRTFTFLKTSKNVKNITNSARVGRGGDMREWNGINLTDICETQTWLGERNVQKCTSKLLSTKILRSTNDDAAGTSLHKRS